MKPSNYCTVTNGNITYTISKDEEKFLVIDKIGDKKEEFLDEFYEFLSPDCPPINPAEDISRDLFRYVIEPLENNKPLILNKNLFFKFGKWATYQTNFHVCRGTHASRILMEILGINISRSDISKYNPHGYFPLTTEEIFYNIFNKIGANKSLVINYD
jgi:hypothetical protein